MNVADEAGLRNFKDFLLVYNQMSELCFNRCIVNLNSRSLTEEEAACSDVCVTKQMKFNQKTMAVYMVEQPKILEQKMETAQAENEKMMKQLQEQGVDTSAMMQQGGIMPGMSQQEGGVMSQQDGGVVSGAGDDGVMPGIVEQTQPRTESVGTISEDVK